MNRPITFRKIEAGHYVNDETGVEIVNTGMPGSSTAARWIVRRPTGRHGFRVVGDGQSRKTDVMDTAINTVEEGRGVIARAYKDAAIEDVDRAHLAVLNEHHTFVINEHIALAMRAANEALTRGDLDQARAFAREAASAVTNYRGERQAAAWADRRDRHPVYAANRPTTSDSVAMLRAGRAIVEEDHAAAIAENVARTGRPLPADKAVTAVGRTCCVSTVGNVHNCSCSTPEARRQWDSRTVRAERQAAVTTGEVRSGKSEGAHDQTSREFPMLSRGTGGGKTRDSRWLLDLGRGTGLPEFRYAREVSKRDGTPVGAIDDVARRHLLVGCATVETIGLLAEPCTETGQHRHDFDTGEIVFGTTLEG